MDTAHPAKALTHDVSVRSLWVGEVESLESVSASTSSLFLVEIKIAFLRPILACSLW